MSTNAVDQQRTTRPSLLSALLLLSAGWLSASPSHASVTGAWSDNVSRDQSFSRVLVVGISPDRNARCAFERALASKIGSATTVAIVSCDVMGVRRPAHARKHRGCGGIEKRRCSAHNQPHLPVVGRAGRRDF